MPHANRDERRKYQREYNQREDVKEKRAKYLKEWSRKNAAKRAEAESRRKMERRARILVTNCKKRVRSKNLAFDLEQHIGALQEVIDRGTCEVTGLPFNLQGGRTFDSPSLDRIDPAKGYTIENVRIVLFCVNSALGDWGEGKFREVMRAWMKR